MNIMEVLSGIGGRCTPERKIPEALKPFSCFVPDSGYCVLAVPEIFADNGDNEPEMYVVPLPEKYVVENGWRMLGSGVPCVDVPYDNMLGAMVDERYDTWR